MVTEQINFVLFKVTSCLIRNLKHRRSAVPHEQCWGPHPSHLAILEKTILEAKATTTSFHVRTFHMKTVKVKNCDVFISDSRSLLIIYVEQGDWIYRMCANDLNLNCCAVRSTLIARSANCKEPRRNSTCMAQSKRLNFRYSFQNILILSDEGLQYETSV